MRRAIQVLSAQREDFGLLLRRADHGLREEVLQERLLERDRRLRLADLAPREPHVLGLEAGLRDAEMLYTASQTESNAKRYRRRFSVRCAYMQCTSPRSSL